MPTPRSNSMAMVRLAIGLLGVCAVVAAFGLVSGARRYAEAGNPYPGAFVSVAEPVGFFAASLAGALCLGALIHVVMTAKPEPDGLIDAAAFRIHLLAERVSGLWLGLAATMVVIQAAHDTEVGPARLLASGALWTPSPPPRWHAGGLLRRSARWWLRRRCGCTLAGSGTLCCLSHCACRRRHRGDR